jgi:DNA-binding MarR family transcriptional regulator
VEDSISFLIAQVCKTHRNTANALLQERLELYAGQDMFLNFLAHHDGASQSDLAQSLCVEAPTITRMVQRLGQAGLVERSPDPDDARVTRLHVTEKGRSVVGQMDEVWQEIESRAMVDFNTEECAQLRRLLTRVRDNLAHSQK